jgi:hypothetical protein
VAQITEKEELLNIDPVLCFKDDMHANKKIWQMIVLLKREYLFFNASKSTMIDQKAFQHVMAKAEFVPQINK